MYIHRIWKKLDPEANCIFETIADEDTVIFSRYANDKSGESSKDDYYNLYSEIKR